MVAIYLIFFKLLPLIFSKIAALPIPAIIAAVLTVLAVGYLIYRKKIQR
jgi:hypothetical protein